MMFHKVFSENIDILDLDWLEEIPSVRKADFKAMVWKVTNGEWQLWRLGAPAQGVAVTYPWEGRLFIYYLRGTGLFATLTREDLLSVARLCALDGCMAETSSRAMLRILKSLGFEIMTEGPERWTLELRNGRQ